MAVLEWKGVALLLALFHYVLLILAFCEFFSSHHIVCFSLRVPSPPAHRCHVAWDPWQQGTAAAAAVLAAPAGLRRGPQRVPRHGGAMRPLRRWAVVARCPARLRRLRHSRLTRRGHKHFFFAFGVFFLFLSFFCIAISRGNVPLWAT